MAIFAGARDTQLSLSSVSVGNGWVLVVYQGIGQASLVKVRSL